ncbi:hypothetical protein Goshw_005738, partial [Gossypium schwendimanii]|nr:hypothetical protein [Gossypium schwendimanii]
WEGLYTIHQVTPHEAIELIRKGGQLFLVNGQRIKHYFRGTKNTVVDEQFLQCNTV